MAWRADQLAESSADQWKSSGQRALHLGAGRRVLGIPGAPYILCCSTEQSSVAGGPAWTLGQLRTLGMDPTPGCGWVCSEGVGTLKMPGSYWAGGVEVDTPIATSAESHICVAPGLPLLAPVGILRSLTEAGLRSAVPLLLLQEESPI